MIDYLLNVVNIFGKHKYNYDWDVMLTNILEKGIIKEVGFINVTYEYNDTDIVITVDNFPYSFGYPIIINDRIVAENLRYHPKFATMVALRKKVNEFRKTSIDAEFNNIYKDFMK